MERTVRRIAETTTHPGMNPQHRVRMVLEPGNWREYDPFLMLAETGSYQAPSAITRTAASRP